MKKILLVAVIVLMCAGMFACEKEPKSTLNNSSTNSSETEPDAEVETTTVVDNTTTEETSTQIVPQGNGTISIDEVLAEYIESAYKTDLIEVYLKSNSDWYDVRESFILNNEIEFIYPGVLILSKEQLENVQPAGDYDVTLGYTRQIASVPLTETDLEKMDKTETYDVCIAYRGSGKPGEYKSEVASLLGNHDIDADRAYDYLTNWDFRIKLSYDEIIKLYNDPMVAYVSRITIGEGVFFG